MYMYVKIRHIACLFDSTFNHPLSDRGLPLTEGESLESCGHV